MEREMEKATREKREKVAFIDERVVKRVCGNPDCLAEWDSEHITICLKCGWGTRKVE